MRLLSRLMTLCATLRELTAPQGRSAHTDGLSRYSNADGSQ
jgi:hypothetical protein